MNKETEIMPFHREDVRGSASLKKIFFKKPAPCALATPGA